MKRQEIVDEARRFVEMKTKWGRMGREDTRLDCYGLILRVRMKFGLKCEDFERYSLYPVDHLAMDVMKRQFTQTDQPLKPGMVAVFAYSGRPWHMGIVGINRYGQTTIIHCSALRGAAFEEPFEGPLKGHLRTAFEFPGVED